MSGRNWEEMAIGLFYIIKNFKTENMERNNKATTSYWLWNFQAQVPLIHDGANSIAQTL